MPTTKKTKPGESVRKSKNLANLFFIVNVICLLVLLFLKNAYNVPAISLLLTWLVITTISLAILWYVNRNAAQTALTMLGQP